MLIIRQGIIILYFIIQNCEGFVQFNGDFGANVLVNRFGPRQSTLCPIQFYVWLKTHDINTYIYILDLS